MGLGFWRYAAVQFDEILKVFGNFLKVYLVITYFGKTSLHCGPHNLYVIFKVFGIFKVYLVFLNWTNPGLFFIYFRLFKHVSLTFLQQINVNNVMSIQYPVPGFELTTFIMSLLP